MEYRYKTRGTCSREILIDVEGDYIRKVTFIGGCDGNTKGISAIVQGMKVQDVIARFRGITCGMKKTSCPDQLAIALEKSLEAKS